MPAFTPVNEEQARLLTQLGERIRLARKRRGLTAKRAAALAGITRVTLHRLEVGEPAAVSLGTLTGVLDVLDMSGDLMLLARDDHMGHRLRDAQLVTPRVPARPRLIALKDLPHLKEVAAWHVADDEVRLTPQEAFDLYERNWRHIDPGKIVGKEAQVLRRLTKTVGKGVMLV